MEALAAGYLCRYTTLDELVRDLRRADQLESLRQAQPLPAPAAVDRR